jgi:hypothetical protein
MKKRRRYNIKTHRPSKTNKKKENGKRILFGIDLQSSKLHSHFLLARVGNFFGSMLLTLFFFFCFFLILFPPLVAGSGWWFRVFQPSSL